MYVRTFATCDEKGTPPSLAKDQICREAVAVSATTLPKSEIIGITAIIVAPAILPVALWKTSKKGAPIRPVSDERTASTSYVQKASVMIMRRPRVAFSGSAVMIDLGSVLEASFTSSAVIQFVSKSFNVGVLQNLMLTHMDNRINASH